MMWFRQIVVVAISVSFISSASAQSPRVSASEVFRRVKNSVVVIMGENQQERVQGSGFIVAPDKVVTNYHVVEGQDVLTVKFSDESVRPVKRVTIWDRERDLALLDVPTGSRPPLVIGSEHSLHEGDDVLAIGAPLGLELTITNGIVSSFRLDQETHLIQTTTSIAPGSSGGPLLDSSGKVVGVTTFRISDNPGLYFSVAVTELKHLGIYETPVLVLETPETAAISKPSRPASKNSKTVHASEPSRHQRSEEERLDQARQQKEKEHDDSCFYSYLDFAHRIMNSYGKPCASTRCTGEPTRQVIALHNKTCPDYEIVRTDLIAEMEDDLRKEQDKKCHSEYERLRKGIISGDATIEVIDKFNKTCPAAHKLVPAEVLADEEQRKTACISEYEGLRRAIIAGDSQICDSKGCAAPPAVDVLVRHNLNCPNHRVVLSELERRNSASAPAPSTVVNLKNAESDSPFIPPVDGWVRVDDADSIANKTYNIFLLNGGPDDCHFTPQELKKDKFWGVIDCFKAGRYLFFVARSGPRIYLLKKQGKTPPSGEYASKMKHDKMCVRDWTCYEVLAEIRPVTTPSR